MTLTTILLNALPLFFVFLTLNLFLNTYSLCRVKKQQRPISIIFLFLMEILYAIPDIPFYIIIAALCDFIYTLLICKGTFRAKLKVYLKYECYYIVCSAAIVVIHTLCTQDYLIYLTNELYADYSSVIGHLLLYVILSMYIIVRKLSNFPSGKIYKRYFLVITSISVILLTVCSMLLGSAILKHEDIIPLLFSLLVVMVMLCIFIYKKIVIVLEENALSKIEIEKNALAQDYYTQVQEGLKSLSMLRHDFKNHLIILQGYASSGKTTELQNYIRKLSNELTPATIITTPSQLLSAIINAKNEECKEKGIAFTFDQQVKQICIDDFHMITIFGNLLDNAILAASKCEAGEIHLSLSTVNSYLNIDCVNNHVEKILEKNGHFMTTKSTHKELHGLGIPSMSKAAKELRGEITIDHTDEQFHVNILVPNYF